MMHRESVKYWGRKGRREWRWRAQDLSRSARDQYRGNETVCWMLEGEHSRHCIQRENKVLMDTIVENCRCSKKSRNEENEKIVAVLQVIALSRVTSKP